MLKVIKAILSNSKTKKVDTKIEMCEMSANSWWS